MKPFSEWTIDEVEKTFNLTIQRQSDLLDDWLNAAKGVSQTPTVTSVTLESMRQNLIDYVHSWNEAELKIKFIGPLLALVNFDQENYQSFFERTISATYRNSDILSGDVDFLVATGMRVPEQPFFFLHEHKREADSSGDPLGQLMIAMVAAQLLNQTEQPIYGTYVLGRFWFFVVLHQDKYAVSLAYDATRMDIHHIYGVLLRVKAIIDDLVR